MQFHRKGQFGMPLGDQNPTKTTPFINWMLIGANVIAFIISLGSLEYFVNTWGFVPASLSIFNMFTSMFLHGGFEHILGNMWFLFIFGDNIEDTFGHIPYLLFYLAAGIAATVAHLLLNLGSTIPAVGASGAISGVLGAYLVLFPSAGVYVSGQLGHRGLISAKLMLGAWFVFQFISGVLGLFGEQSGIAFWAHIGGFVFGVIVALIYRMVKR
jgi:membrane associated rhomboid family serine protease